MGLRMWLTAGRRSRSCIYAGGPGSAPICCSTWATSTTDQYSTILPSRMRWITIPAVSISRGLRRGRAGLARHD